MRIVFVGAVEFSRRALESVVAAGGEVVGVLTLDPALAARHGDFADLAPTAAAAGIPVHPVQNVNDPETLGLIRSLRPDVLFVFGWSQLLGPELLGVAPVIGSHPALLPRNRGRHPITWALVEGLTESGLTFLWLDEGIDSGDILWQRSFPIGPDDDAATLLRRIEDLADEAIREFVPQLRTGSAPRIPQDHAHASAWRRRTDADRWIDWNRSSKEVHDLVRGLARPYVGALTRRGRQDVHVWRTRMPTSPLPAASAGAAPGTVLEAGAEAAVRTGDGHLLVLELEPDVLRPGDVLEGPS